MKPRIITFDIETGKAPDYDNYRPVFEAKANLTDPKKIEADIEEKRLKWESKLALSAVTGRVIVAGFFDGEKTTVLEGDEKNVIEKTLSVIADEITQGNRIVGHNIHGFDLPFIIRRAMKHRLRVPFSLLPAKGRYWDERLVDTQVRWANGQREEYISLDELAKFLGVGEKTGSGAEFEALYASDKAAALEYLANDLKLTRLCYDAMGVEY